MSAKGKKIVWRQAGPPVSVMIGAIFGLILGDIFRTFGAESMLGAAAGMAADPPSVMIVLDGSGSMSGAPIEALNAGLKAVTDDGTKDEIYQQYFPNAGN